MARTKTLEPQFRLHLRVAGWLPDDWCAEFEGIGLRQVEDGTTLLFGKLKDQSALFGVLRAIENRGITLIACFAYPGGLS
jgi:hypothetical protein